LLVLSSRLDLIGNDQITCGNVYSTLWQDGPTDALESELEIARHGCLLEFGSAHNNPVFARLTSLVVVTLGTSAGPLPLPMRRCAQRRDIVCVDPFVSDSGA
jgi:hypothetical protein